MSIAARIQGFFKKTSPEKKQNLIDSHHQLEEIHGCKSETGESFIQQHTERNKEIEKARELRYEWLRTSDEYIEQVKPILNRSEKSVVVLTNMRKQIQEDRKILKENEVTKFLLDRYSAILFNINPDGSPVEQIEDLRHGLNAAKRRQAAKPHRKPNFNKKQNPHAN